jgi:hypothetical protein
MLTFSPWIDKIQQAIDFTAFPSSVLNEARQMSEASIVASAGAVTHQRLAKLISFVIKANPAGFIQ